MSMHSDAAHRVHHAFEIINNLWNTNDINQDIMPEYAAAQIWAWAPNCYSLLEQSLKVLWATRKKIELSEIKSEIMNLEGGRSGLHDLEFLFGLQTDSDKKILGTAFQSCRRLHDYLPITSLPEFLKSIGRGYTDWRYMLIEGIEKLPGSHIDTMIELAEAATLTLMHEHHRNINYRSIEVRIQESLDRAAFNAATMEYASNYPELDNDDEYMEYFKSILRQTHHLIERNPVLVLRYLDLAKEPMPSGFVPQDDTSRIALICRDLPPNELKHLRQYFFKQTPLGKLNLSGRESDWLRLRMYEARTVLDRAQDSGTVENNRLMRLYEAERRIKELESDLYSLDKDAKHAVDRLAELDETEVQWVEIDAAIDLLLGPTGQE